MEQIVQKIVQEFIKDEAFRKPYENIWIKCYKEYRFYRPRNKKYPWRANLCIPRAFQVVETITPPTAMSIFAVSPVITVLPLEGAPVEFAQNHEILIDTQLKEQDFMKVAVEWIKEALMYGTSILKVYPYFFSGKYLYPKIELIDLFDFYIAPDFFSHQIHRSYKDKSYLVALAQRGIYDKGVVNEIIKGEEGASSWNLASDDRLTYIGEGLSKDVNIRNKKVEILEYWGKYDINDDKIPEEVVITIANRKHLLRIAENPIGLRPFVSLNAFPVPHEFFGIGLIEPILGLTDELSTKRNQRLDNVNIGINQMFIIDKYAEVEVKDLVSRPGGIVRAGRTDAVVPLQIPDITQSYNIDIEMIEKDIQAITAAYPYLAGAPPQRKETAAGIISLQNAASARFKLMIELLNQISLKQLGNLMIKYNQKFYKSETVSQIIDRGNIREVQERSISPEQLKGKFKVFPVASADEGFGNRQIRQVNMMKLFDFISKIPPQMIEGYKLNLTPLIRRILHLFDIKETKDILQKLPPPQPEIPQGMPGETLPPEVPPETIPEQLPGGGVPQMPGAPGAMAPGTPMTQEQISDTISKLLGGYNRVE